MAGLSFMQRRPSGIYEFRRRLPQALAGKPVPEHAKTKLAELINPATGNFKQYLTISLKTQDHKTAKRRDLDEARRVTELFEWGLKLVQGGSPEPATTEEGPFSSPEEIEAHFLHSLLEADEQERNEGDDRRYHQTAEERSAWPDLQDPLFGELGMAEGHLEALGEINSELLNDYRQAFARRRPDIIRPEYHSYLKDKKVPIEPNTDRYRQGALAVLRAHVKAYEIIQERQAGKDIPTPAMPQISKEPTISEALDLWRKGTLARGGKKPSASTVREAKRAVRYFVEWHTDLRLGDITRDKARDFRNALSRLPTRLKGTDRALPLRALLDKVGGKGEVVHGASVNKYLNLLVAIVSAVEREGQLDSLAGFSNPFAKLSLTIDKRNDPNRREPFSEANLKALLGSEVYAANKRPLGGGGEAAYWLPLIALLSGARLNEIAQLRVKDIAQDAETGIWFIDIGTDGDRAIKTVSSRRQVPLHPELIRLGLLNYRQNRLDKDGKDSTSLWPEIKSANEAYRSTAWSKWFNRYLRETVNIKDPSIVFHSFRHTFKRMARDAGISEELHDALTGHAGGGGVGRSYGSGFGLKALAEAMAKIEAPSAIRELGNEI